MGAWGTGLYQDDIADETYTCEILTAALYFKTGTSTGVTRPQTMRRTQDLLRVF